MKTLTRITLPEGQHIEIQGIYASTFDAWLTAIEIYPQATRITTRRA
jgi:hypothetical protein